MDGPSDQTGERADLRRRHLAAGRRAPSQAPMPAGLSEQTGERADLRRRHPATGSRAPSQAPMPQSDT
eukprot:8160211-Heterocapsa_arctica.AAC.1